MDSVIVEESELRALEDYFGTLLEWYLEIKGNENEEMHNRK